MAKFRAGANMDIRFIHAGGTVIFTTGYRTLSYDVNANLLETTAGNDGWKNFITGIQDGKVSLEIATNGTATPIGTADLATMVPGLSGTLYLSPFGTASGMIKYGGPFVVDTRGMPMPYDDLHMCAWDFQSNGTIADGTW